MRRQKKSEGKEKKDKKKKERRMKREKEWERRQALKFETKREEGRKKKAIKEEKRRWKKEKDSLGCGIGGSFRQDRSEGLREDEEGVEEEQSA